MHGNAHVRFWRRAGEVNFSRLAIKLRPTPAQEQALDEVLWRCRELYNSGLEERKTAWERCHVSLTRYDQEAELKAIRAAFSEYAAIHSHVLQEVLARLERAYHAFFRRVQAGEKAGYPRFVRRSKLNVAMSGGWCSHPLSGVCPTVPT